MNILFKFCPTVILILCAFLGVLSNPAFGQKINLALGKTVTVNSENPSFPGSNVVDGKITRNSKWMTASGQPPHILEIDFPNYCNISEITVHTGIPEQEKTPAEKVTAAGFWSAKNFKLQYWDDANWTDIPNTEVHENRLTEVKFSFPQAINTFRIRLICDDGEPISIMEFEVFGSETKNVAPLLKTDGLAKKTIRTENQNIKLKIGKREVGKSMKYVGYNQGYYMPGSNASGWLEYAGVNSVRVWTTLNSYAPISAIQVDKTLTTISEFDRRKQELRLNPEQNRFINWERLLSIYNDTEKAVNTNPMVLNYVLTELKRLKIDPVVQIGSIDFNETWSNKWQQWQRFYALAYYMAKTGDVTMFAMQNEPNHRLSGMTLAQWLSGSKIVSDAIHCAIADVNIKYSKNLAAKMVGPVTAGNNPEWWAAVMKDIRTDYHNKKVDEDLIQIFSTHSYNSPAAGYANRVNDIRKIITENHPVKKTLPIVYTEIGRWMNAYLIDKEETMDSPSLFTEWAGIYANNTKNGAYGMWAFKFSNTSSDVFSRGVKSGHHFTWQGKRIVEDAMVNLAFGQKTKTHNSTSAATLTDGVKTDQSSWISGINDEEKWIDIELQSATEIGSAIIYSGSAGGVYTAPDRIKSFKLQYFIDDKWKDIPGTVVKENKFAQLQLLFKQSVTTNKVRFWSDDPGVIKLREIKLFDPKYNTKDPEKNYDISGIQRTGEVVRLFAKGFKNEVPLLQTTADVTDENFDAMTSFDEQTGNYYIWLVQRGNYVNKLSIDLSALNVDNKLPISAELVNNQNYGEVSEIVKLDGNKKISMSLPKESVMLVTIPTAKLSPHLIKPNANATVIAGKSSNENMYGSKKMYVALNASNADQNQVSYMQFADKELSKAKRAFLKVNGAVNAADSAMRIHVYAIPNTTWKEKELNWRNAPQLDAKEALIREVGTKAFVAGELAFDSSTKTHVLDVTEILKKHPSTSLTFVLIRETRQMGDDDDKGKILTVATRDSGNSPILEIWK